MNADKSLGAGKDESARGRGCLYLLPVALGAGDWRGFLPTDVQAVAARLRHFVVETARSARAHLKQIEHPGPLRELDIRELPAEGGSDAELDALLAPALGGHDLGLMSDAGCPAVADPGARLVARAHALGLRVVPLVGPSSILLGLMASGLNGQSFAFHGYLPVGESERDATLRALEEESRKFGRTQLFIETPYRNGRMFDAILKCCQAQTRLCVACDLNCADEWVRTLRVRDWKRQPAPALARRPTLFLLLA